MHRAGWNYPTGEFRVSDADRDRAVTELSEAFQAGRLTADEFDERSGQALGARTGKELAVLLADLPAAVAPPAHAAPARALEGSRRRLAHRASVAAAIAGTCFAIGAAGSALSTGPSIAQQEAMRNFAIRQGLPVGPWVPYHSGFNWAGTLPSAIIAVLLIGLFVFLRVRLARTDRS
jgi:hypothetical protein